MSTQKAREVVRKGLGAEEVQEVAIPQQEVPQDPRGMMLARGLLLEKLLRAEVADLEEGLLSNDSE